jgi:hypothetical protein
MLDDYEKLECVICQEELFVSEGIKVLDCGHSFHQECIDKWINIKNSCPSCRNYLGEEEVTPLINLNRLRTKKWFICFSIYLGINMLLCTGTLMVLFSHPINLSNSTNY